MTSETGVLAGVRVLSLESRMANEMRHMLTRLGATATVVPSVREIPLENNVQALDCVEGLVAGRIEILILLTGVGLRALGDVAQTRYSRDQWLAALKNTKLVVRGPKPAAVLREWGVPFALAVPEPNTWRELIATLDAHLPVSGRTVAVQEYGQPNPELYEALTARQAKVTRVPVYRWELPEDASGLEAAVRQTLAGEFDAIVFTSASQLQNILTIAERLGCRDEWLAAASRAVIASIGPTASETLRATGLNPTLEPEHPKMGHLVQALASHYASSKPPRPGTDETT